MTLLQSAPSWDLVITLVYVIGVTYGFIMLRDRVLVTLLSLYAGNLLANLFAPSVQKFFNGDVAILNKLWVESSMSPFTIKMGLFAIVVILLSAKSGLTGRRHNFSFLEMAAYSFFNVSIALVSVFSFMEPDKLKAYTDASKLVAAVMQHQTVWFIAPLVVLAVLGSSTMSRGRSDDY
jgi:hypothetical protein